jgi:predicted ATPase/class 3 adenylate cyclase
MEAQRAALGDAVVDAAVGSMRRQLAELEQVQRASAPALRGERKLVTVMFADISGFTALSETMDPETVRDLVNACFERLVPVVRKYGGTVDKFIGDDIMALFGAPTAHEDDPECALRAALEMTETLKTFNLERSTDLGLHFGINTGQVIAGGLGTQDRQEYSVMGNAVNVAARLEELSERGEILVVEFEMLEPIEIKGKAEPVPVYRLRKAKPVRGKARGIEGLESPLVGRDTEFQTLQDAISRLHDGVGGIVTVVGEAGLGKSRLVAEARVQSATHLQWIEGRCLSYGGSIAYLMWLDMLRSILDVAADAQPLAVRDALRTQLQLLCSDCFDAVYPYLAKLMSLPLENTYETMQNLQGESLRTEIFLAVRTLIESAARQQPLVVVCELLILTDHAPVLFLCVFRPEMRHGCWRIKETADRLFGHRYTDIWLDPLSSDESAVLAGNLLRLEALPHILRDKILNYAEGNPFYMEEIIRSLVNDEIIVPAGAAGRWQATRNVDAIALPNTLHGVLMARIDRLQEETKRVLQLASVIGRVFFYYVLAEIVRQERELDSRLLALQQEQMIRERARVPERTYIFKHELTREAAYNSLLRKERRAYHRQVAEALESRWTDVETERAEVLAYHYVQAGDDIKALTYLMIAGERAAARYANEEAIDYFEQAAERLSKQPEAQPGMHWRLAAGLGDAYRLVGRHADSMDTLKAGLALTESKDLSTELQAGLYRRLGQTAKEQGDLDLAYQCFDKALTMLGDPVNDMIRVEAARSMAGTAWVHFLQGRFEKARQACEASLDHAREANALSELAVAENLLGGIYWRQSEWALALHHTRRAQVLREQMGYTWGVASTIANLGILEYMAGEWDKARSYFQRSLAMRQEMGDVHGMAIVYNNLGLVARDQGSLDIAEEHFRESLTMATRFEMGYHIANSGIGLAQVLLLRGKSEAAREAIDAALRQTDVIGASDLQAEAYQVQAEIMSSTSEWDEALCAAERSAAMAIDSGNRGLEVKARRVISEIELARGNPQVAREALAQAQAILADVTDELEIGRVSAQAGRIDLYEGHVLQAKEHLQTAQQIFRRLGASLDLEHVEKALK